MKQLTSFIEITFESICLTGQFSIALLLAADEEPFTCKHYKKQNHVSTLEKTKVYSQSILVSFDLKFRRSKTKKRLKYYS